MTTALQLAPEVLARLHQLQQADRPVSVDEILQAANLNHLALPVQQPTQSKSAETRTPKRQQQQLTAPLRLEKSASTLTLAERRRIPVSPKKLKLYAQISTSQSSSLSASSSSLQQQQQTAEAVVETTTTDRNEQMKKLEQENAKLPPQDSEEYLLAHLERQNALLQADPKSISMEANHLQADFNTLRQLVTDNDSTIETTDISDWDFWQCLVDDYSTAVAKLPHLVSAKLRHGVPHALRGVVWQAMAQSASTRLESMYESLLNTDGTSPYARVIQRDLSRTFPTVEMFKCDGGQGQQAMERILTSYSIYDVQVGYCQGLAFLVGPLLMTMPEKQAFSVFVRLMETYDMRTMFTLNMEGLHLRLHQFQALLSQFCPRLDAHLTFHSIHPAMYASQWYLTLFAYSLPIDVVMRIYDLVFAEGAVETITRVAIALMQKNEDTLLEINDFEQLMIYLSSKQLFEAYQSDAEAVIADTMALSHAITKAKMDNIAETHDKELEQEKTRAHQVLAIRFGGWKRSSLSLGPKSPTSTASAKRESWFPWQQQQQQQQQQQHRRSSSNTVKSPVSPTTPSTPLPTSRPSMDRTVPLLHKQIEDLVTALSQLQKEHSQLTENVMTMKMDAMDYMSANDKLVERNAQLTKRLKKYKQRFSSSTLASSSSFASCPSLSPFSTDTSFSSLVDKANASRLQVLENDEEFCSFVSSLRMTGDFGSLIASALSSNHDQQQQQQHQDANVDLEDELDEDEDEDDLDDDDDCLSRTTSPFNSTATTATSATNEENDDNVEKTANNNSNIDELDTITQELVTVKLANFEMGQKYETMCHQNETLQQQLTLSQNKEQMYLDQIAVLEKVRADQAQEIDTIVKANESLSERIMAAKQTSVELQMDKLQLSEQVTRLDQHVQQLEREKLEYLKPRDSFSEEVFAAHQTLFGEGSVFFQQRQQQQQQKDGHRRWSSNSNSNCSSNSSGNNDDHTYQEDYQRKYVDAEIRCRELEKLLAEAKCKLVDYETATTPSQKRPTSLTMLSSKPGSNTISTVKTPTMMTREDSRMSTDSMSTTTSSKRSSVYSRLWNSIASPTTPSSTDVLPFNNKTDGYPALIHTDMTPL